MQSPDNDAEEPPFSVQLTEWLASSDDKTISDLEDLFGDKSFALTFLVLMAIPALPLPTAGVTHVFEVITMLLSLELIAQRRTMWLPKRWRNKKLGNIMQTKTLPYLIKWIRRVEKISHPRMSKFLDSRLASTLFGISIFLLALTALLAIPFSGLDTLPAMGALGISLGFILEDIVIVCIGGFLGLVGMVLSIGFGAAIYEIVSGWF